MAFVSAASFAVRPSSTPLAVSSFTPSVNKNSVVSARRATLRMSMDDSKPKPKIPQIPQGFTSFSEQLNGRAAMLGFVLALTTELITGKGIVGQLGSVFEVVNTAKALMN